MNNDVLVKIRKVGNYQFGKGAGDKLFPDRVKVTFSKRTGRIRHVYLDGKLLATLKPNDGFFSLTIEGAERLLENGKPNSLWVQVTNDVARFVEKGSDVFAKHIIDADREIRPMEEVIVVDKDGRVIAVGKAMLSGDEMKTFTRGIAVKVRRGRIREN